MKQEIISALKKTVKIAGVTCLSAGSIAVLTSGMALKASAREANIHLRTSPCTEGARGGSFSVSCKLFTKQLTGN